MKRYDLNSDNEMEEYGSGDWVKNEDAEDLEMKLADTEGENQKLEAQLEESQQEVESLEMSLEQEANEGYEARIELEEYEKVELISADDKMRWDKIIELFPLLTWSALKIIEQDDNTLNVHQQHPGNKA